MAGKEDIFGACNLVMCVDVMEHVETEKVPAVLAHITGLADYGVYLVIALRPASHTLPDGSNAHRTVMVVEWWQEAIMKLKGFDWAFIVREDLLIVEGIRCSSP